MKPDIARRVTAIVVIAAFPNVVLWGCAGSQAPPPSTPVEVEDCDDCGFTDSDDFSRRKPKVSPLKVYVPAPRGKRTR